MLNNQMLNKMFNPKHSPMCNASCVLIEERLRYINLMIEEHKLITDTTVALNIMFINNVMSCYDDITNTINIEFNNSDKVIIKLFENYFNNVKKFIESVNKLSDDYMLSNTIFQTNLNTMICLNNMLVEKLNELRND
jgi:hypothetical protein